MQRITHDSLYVEALYQAQILTKERNSKYLNNGETPEVQGLDQELGSIDNYLTDLEDDRFDITVDTRIN